MVFRSANRVMCLDMSVASTYTGPRTESQTEDEGDETGDRHRHTDIVRQKTERERDKEKERKERGTKKRREKREWTVSMSVKEHKSYPNSTSS